MSLWEAWRLSKAYQVRPSEFYGIHDEFEAWCFDRAVFLFGSSLDSELREAADGAKNKNQSRQRQQRVLDRWLRDEDQPRQFKDPAVSASPHEVPIGPGSGPVSL